MLGALLTFLLGCLILMVVLYATNLVLAMIELPGNIKQLVLLVLGLICLVILIMLAVNVFRGTGPALGW